MQTVNSSARLVLLVFHRRTDQERKTERERERLLIYNIDASSGRVVCVNELCRPFYFLEHCLSISILAFLCTATQRPQSMHIFSYLARFSNEALDVLLFAGLEPVPFIYARLIRRGKDAHCSRRRHCPNRERPINYAQTTSYVQHQSMAIGRI